MNRFYTDSDANIHIFFYIQIKCNKKATKSDYYVGLALQKTDFSVRFLSRTLHAFRSNGGKLKGTTVSYRLENSILHFTQNIICYIHVTKSI